MISESVTFILGAVVGGLLVWLWIQIRASYGKMRGALQAREKAKAEKAKQAQRAREEIVKGRRALFRTSILFIVGLVLAGLLVGAIFVMVSL